MLAPSMRTSILASLLVLALPGCPTGMPMPRDAGRARDAAFDAGRDAGAMDDAAMEMDAPAEIDAAPEGDAFVAVDGGRDAAVPTDSSRDAVAALDVPTAAPPAIDGVIGPTEWAGAAMAAGATPTIWTGNELLSIRALLLGGGLYLAIEGRIEGGNSIVVYVDRTRGASEGVTLASLTDSTGALDSSITAGFATPSDVRPDLGWGTLDLSRAATGADDRMGWRDFVRAASPDDLYWILPIEAPTVCGAAACEAMLPRAALDLGSGAMRPRTVAIFARIANHDGTMSPNQTLPMDDPAMPRTVSALLEIAEP
jgi:hypothetical protein